MFNIIVVILLIIINIILPWKLGSDKFGQSFGWATAFVLFLVILGSEYYVELIEEKLQQNYNITIEQLLDNEKEIHE